MAVPVSNVFQDWILAQGGYEVVAEKLGVSADTVKYWAYRRGYPRVEMLLRIVRVSKGKLTLEDIIYSIRRDFIRKGK